MRRNDRDLYVIKKWTYVSDGNEHTTSSDRFTIYEGSESDCVKWLKVKYLDLAIKSIDTIDFNKQDISIEDDRVCYTTINQGTAYRYESTSYVMEPKFFF